MPLMHSKSKKAFGENVEAEMHAGKPQKQALAIAYSVKRKATKKKMAEGGPVSAKTEKRPMPDQKANDSRDVEQNDHKKSLPESMWTDRPEERQAAKGMKTTAIKHPRMVPSDAYSVRLRDEEDHLQSTAKPASDKEQPPKADNEEDAAKKGPSIPALKMKKMAKGGEVSGSHDEDEAEHAALNEHMVSEEEGAGPEQDNDEHPAGLKSDNDMMAPSEDEIMADHFAEGGMAHEFDMQPEDEHEEEMHASLAAAIMAHRHAKAMMAEGGEVDLSVNNEETPADESPYDEFNIDAAGKENYADETLPGQPEDSNETGDSREADEENSHDMIPSIRRKMSMKRHFKG